MRFELLSRNSVFSRERMKRAPEPVPGPRRGLWRQLIDWLTEL